MRTLASWVLNGNGETYPFDSIVVMKTFASWVLKRNAYPNFQVVVKTFASWVLKRRPLFSHFFVSIQNRNKTPKICDYPLGPKRIRFTTFFSRIVPTLGDLKKKGRTKSCFVLRFRHLLIGPLESDFVKMNYRRRLLRE